MVWIAVTSAWSTIRSPVTSQERSKPTASARLSQLACPSVTAGGPAGGGAAGAGDIAGGVAVVVGAAPGDGGAEEVIGAGEGLPRVVDGLEPLLAVQLARGRVDRQAVGPVADVRGGETPVAVEVTKNLDDRVGARRQIGRASCRER